MRKICFISMVLWMACMAKAQDSTDVPEKWQVSGYIRDLQDLSFNKKFTDLVSGNLLHHRLNLKWKPQDNLTVTAEWRNRFFWGEVVRMNPGFDQSLRNPAELVNMQKTWVHHPAWILHSSTERLHVEYRKSRWNVRLGRQRINWGVTTTWNPNDIFNSYNFLDVDYIERAGADAIKFQYLFHDDSNTELALAGLGRHKGSVAAVKYNLNHWGYDLQWITGWYAGRATIGTGWAGNIGEAGCKGEVQYFFRNKDTVDHLNISLEGDYMFKKNWYVNLGFLYNSRGMTRMRENKEWIRPGLSPVNLMPSRWNLVINSAREITPLFSARLGVFFAPGSNLLILLPALQYNIATNLDIDLVWQSFFSEPANRLEAVNHRCFLRMKWSY